MQSSYLQCSMGRLFFPSYDGSPKCTAKAWVEKLDTYFQLNRVFEMEAIKIVALDLEGEAHEWWFHGLYTLGHASVTYYVYFTQRLVERFDPRNPKAHFFELTKLKQTGYLEIYIYEILKLLVMVSDLTVTRRVCMFIDGLV